MLILASGGSSPYLSSVEGVPPFPLRVFWQTDFPLRWGGYPLNGKNPLSSFLTGSLKPTQKSILLVYMSLREEGSRVTEKFVFRMANSTTSKKRQL